MRPCLKKHSPALNWHKEAIMANDLYNNIKVTTVIKAHSPAATGVISGVVIDTAGYRSTTFVVSSGLQTTTGVTVTPIVKSGTATGSLASAAANDLLGTEAAAALDGTAGASSSSKVGYRGINQYVTCDLLVAAAATGTYNVTCVQSSAIKGPVS
ncbi:MAG: hypothetical protein ABUJ92_00375 [Desulfobacterales bacterium]